MRLHTNPFGQRALAVIAGSLLFSLLAPALQASTPGISRITPRGLQRGTEVDLVVSGARLDDAKELLIYKSGVTVTSLEAKSPTELKAHVRVAKDAPLGEYSVRVRSETGISELRTFYVVPFPIVESKDLIKTDKKGRSISNDFDHPQLVELNQTIAGGLAAEQVAYYAVEMKKGQRLSAEVHAMRLGENFDPYIAILDEKRFELAVSDDSALGMQDPIASTVIPADGRYIIAFRESSYGGGSSYLLHIGTFPRPRIAYPLGGRPGEDLKVTFLGDALGPFTQNVKLPANPISSFPLYPEQNGLVTPSANPIRVSDMPNVLEAEPNNEYKAATNYDGELPVAFNGIIEKAGDVDFFHFKAKKGQQLDVRVVARAMRSPLDSVLTLYNSKGASIQSNDDSGGPDSYLRLNASADDDFYVSVTDQLHDGGVDYAYRVEITPVKPAVVFSIPQYSQNSQERWTVPVPRGNRYATLVRATRADFGGEVKFVVPDLPPGITMQAPDAGVAGIDQIPVVFEAAADAPIAGKLCAVNAQPVAPKAKPEEKAIPAKPIDLLSRYEQKIDLVYTGNSPLYVTSVDSLAVAVTKEAPFKLHLVQPKVPLVQGGSMELKVTAERAAGFKAPISVRLLFTPPGIGALSIVEMPGDKSEVLYPINAQPNAALSTWKICMVAMADVQGQLWTSSELIDLEIGEQYLAANTRLNPIERGKSGKVTFKLEQKTPFNGKAKAKLMGLPANCTAEETEITAKDTEVTFNVTVGEKAPAGNHPTLFCAITVMKDNEAMVHNLGRGGALRIDRPPVPKDETATSGKPAKPDPAKEAAARLEKLRAGKK